MTGIEYRRRRGAGHRNDAKRPVRATGADRGTVSVEFAIVGGAVLVFFFSLLIVAGRVLQMENDVRSAAQAAARAASLRDDIGDATTDAQAVGRENLARSGVSCIDGGNVDLVGGATDFVPGGYVTVQVACTTAVLPNLGIGPSVDFEYQATEVIDEFRGAP